jgi:predicted DNA-binding protein YlxM (UPF0122 family)
MDRSKYAKRLTTEQAAAIRAARSELTYPEIMEEFDVSRQTVANIVKGRVHKREAASQ